MISHAELIDLLSYEPATGHFRWKVKRNSYGGKAKIGAIAGTPDGKGALVIGINRRRYLAHRLAWFYVHQEWPPNEVDHINMVQTDNRIANLRLATKTLNRANQRVRVDSKSGLKGVGYTKKSPKGLPWRARVKNRVVGYFATPEEAHAAYAAEAVKVFREFARAE